MVLYKDNAIEVSRVSTKDFMRSREGRGQSILRGNGTPRDTYGLLEVGDEVVAVLVLLETRERHLRARDVLVATGVMSADAIAGPTPRGTYLLGVLEVLEESVLVPCNALRHVGGSVRVALALAGLATEDTAEGCQLYHSSTSATTRTYPCRLGPTLWGSPAPRVWH